MLSEITCVVTVFVYIATKETYVGKKYLIQTFRFYLSEWSVVVVSWAVKVL